MPTAGAFLNASNVMSNHLTTEELEQYALGRIAEPELTRVEEHLHWCLHCIDRSEAVEKFNERVREGEKRGGYNIELWAKYLSQS